MGSLIDSSLNSVNGFVNNSNREIENDNKILIIGSGIQASLS